VIGISNQQVSSTGIWFESDNEEKTITYFTDGLKKVVCSMQ